MMKLVTHPDPPGARFPESALEIPVDRIGGLRISGGRRPTGGLRRLMSRSSS